MKRFPSHGFRFGFGAVLLIALQGVFLPLSVAAGTTAPTKTFVSTQRHYRVSYPRSWSVQTLPNKDVFSGSTAGGIVTEIVVFVVPVTTGTTNSFVVDTEARLQLAGAGTLHIKTVSIAGYPAKIVSATFGGAHHYTAAAAVFVGAHHIHWEILIEASPSEYARIQSTYLRVLKSFKLA